MTKLTWDKSGDRFFEAGVDRGVLYPNNTNGVVWNGLTSVDESPAGAEPIAYYIDGVKYLNSSSSEEFAATITAFTYPEEFYELDGMASDSPGLGLGEQPRKSFGLCYRTKVGNDIVGQDYGYKLHLIYNALASPTDKSNSSLNDSIDPMTFSWPITTTPVAVFGKKPLSHLTIDSRKTNQYLLAALEDALYGTEEIESHLPTIPEVISMFRDFIVLEVIDNGDGSFTVTGPDEYFNFPSSTEFEITSPFAIYIDAETYTISSYVAYADQGPVNTVPSVPRNVTATSGVGSAVVQWIAPFDDGGAVVTSYLVTASPGGQSTATGVFTGLTNGVAYIFTVTATNSVGTSLPSAPSNVVTPSAVLSATVPSAPTWVSAVAGNTSATVSWTPPINNGGSVITGFHITDVTGAYSVDVDATTNDAVILGLINGNAYTFVVSAINAVGSSAISEPSNWITPTVIPTGPSAPTGVTAVAGNTTVTISWILGADGGSPINVVTVVDNTGTNSVSVSGTTTSLVMTGLINGAEYTFTVTETTIVGTSAPSAPSNLVSPTAPGTYQNVYTDTY